MALLYAPQKKQKTIQRIVAEIQDLDYQGLGVSKIQGKTWFIENALPTEKVEAVVTDESVLLAAKRFTRIALKPYLGDKPLKSRELFTQNVLYLK